MLLASKTEKLRKTIIFQSWYLSDFASGKLCFVGKAASLTKDILMLLKKGGLQRKTTQ